jgi:hypothetical protein
MTKASVWQPGPRPAWVRALNAIGESARVSLDPEELLAEAMRRTGLSDFGGDDFRAGYEVFLAALEDEARLHFIGRLLARADVLEWLENRLRIAETIRRNPEIGRERVERPIFITGLPRTGTSILHELLGSVPGARMPLAWEVRHPCPPPEAASFDDDPRIALAEDEVRLWCEIVPEYDSMHELGARVPVECIQLTAHAFRSDELSGRHVVPRYAAWLAQADLGPAYAFHRRMLQLLQWRAPGERWVLKAPSHLGALASLLAVYPDARIVWTHRDPLAVMASVASILFSTAWVRSDAVDADQVLTWFTGETCAALLAAGSAVRDRKDVDPAQFHDVRYADLVADPVGVVAGIHERFELAFDGTAREQVRAAAHARPRARHGTHRYDFRDTGRDAARERARFRDYQERYGVASEV